MNSSRARIAVVAAILVLALLVLSAHLAHLMLVQREEWRERSAKNRWAFRDVPVRRGSILDRNGIPLVQDEPSFALWLDPKTFLRSHPYGQACALAALLGLQVPSEPMALLRRALALPVSDLLGEGLDEAGQRDVRDLAAKLLSGGFPAKPGTYTRALRAARGTSRALLELVEPALREPGLAVLAARMHAFAALAARLADEGDVDLCAKIARLAASGKEAQRLQVRLLRRASFDLAALVARDRELWPGIVWQPSVQRRRALPGRDGLLSIETVLGTVGTYGGPDLVADPKLAQPDEAEEAALRSLALLPPLDLGDEDDEDLEQAAEEDARRALQRHFRIHGRFGRTGVELACDEDLRGAPGLRMVERDRSIAEKGLLASFCVTPGSDVRLTIDARLQNVLEAVLETTTVDFKQCGVAFIAAETGEVLALGGRPLSDAQGRLAWATPALGWEGPGDLGSAAKPFVLLEQLDAMRHDRTRLDPADFKECDRVWWPDRRQRKLECDKAHYAESRNPIAALAKSCNFYFFQAALGFGDAALRSAYERVGIVFSPDRPEGIAGLAFELGRKTWPLMLRIEQRAIGYGIEANSLQVARAYAALGTGALPHLTLRADRITPPVRLEVADEDLETVRKGLRACITRGTAAKADPILDQLGVLAKTGTAEVVAGTKENNAWLAGLVPRSSGRWLAFAVACYRVPDQTHGGEAGAMIVAALLRAIRADPALAAEYLAEVPR